MSSPAEASMVNHANTTFFAAVELAGQEGKAEEAVSKFEQAIHLYSVIASSTRLFLFNFGST